MDDRVGNDDVAEYSLIITKRTILKFARHPNEYPLYSLPKYYPELKEYWVRVVEQRIDQIDHVLIEENSLMQALQGDDEAAYAYLTLLFGDDIVEESIGSIVTHTGWLITALDYYDDKGDMNTALYISKLTPDFKVRFFTRRCLPNIDLLMH